MPLNPQLFVSLPHADPASLRLLQGTIQAPGAEAPIDVTAAGGPDNFWIRPVTALQPASQYFLKVHRLEQPAIPADDISVISFTTVPSADDAWRDVTAPRITGISFESGGTTGNCGPLTATATLKIKSYEDDLAIGGGAVLQLDFHADGDPSERLFLLHSGLFIDWQDVIAIGDNSGSSDCLGNLRVPGGEVGRPYLASLTVWDWAGNRRTVEGLSFTLAPPTAIGPGAGPTGISKTGGGCSVGGASAYSTGFVLLIAAGAALAYARRPTRRRGCGR